MMPSRSNTLQPRYLPEKSELALLERALFVGTDRNIR
jgi:hypothetical protein